MASMGRRKLTVTSCTKIHSGNDKNGKPYTIYEVFAVDDAGIPVEAKLRAFADLALNELVEYEVNEHKSDKHGVSYTLSVPGKGSSSGGGGGGGGLAGSVDALRERVEKLEARLQALEAAVRSGVQPGPTAAGPTPAALALDHIPH